MGAPPSSLSLGVEDNRVANLPFFWLSLVGEAASVPVKKFAICLDLTGHRAFFVVSESQGYGSPMIATTGVTQIPNRSNDGVR